MSNYFIASASMATFAFATSASPGPVNIISAMSGAQFGVRKSCGFVSGATLGFVAILLIVGIGLGAFLTSSPLITKGLAIAGAGYMLYLAFKLATSKSSAKGGESISPPKFISGAIAQWLNPKAWIVSISAVAIYVANTQNYSLYLALFAGIFFITCFFSLLGWAIIGHKTSTLLNGDFSLFNKIMATVLALSVVYFLYSEFFSH